MSQPFGPSLATLWALYILTRTLRPRSHSTVSNTRHMAMVPWIFSLFNVLKMWKVLKEKARAHSYGQLLGGLWAMGNANGFLWITAIMNISIHNCLPLTMRELAVKLEWQKVGRAVCLSMRDDEMLSSWSKQTWAVHYFDNDREWELLE